MGLEVYTNTYTDIDSNIFDSDDLVEEFWRVAEYINAWAGSVDTTSTTYEEIIEDVDGDVVEIYTSKGVVQTYIINADIKYKSFDFKERVEGSPYRVYVSLRIVDDDFTFGVSGPAGQTHVFARNMPDQIVKDDGTGFEGFPASNSKINGFRNAVIIATFGDNGGLMIEVFSENQEATAVSRDDVLTVAQA